MSHDARRFPLRLVAAIGFAWATTAAVLADDIVWDGQTNDNWQTGTNWNIQCPGGPFCAQFPPGETDNAILTNSSFGTNVELSANVRIRGLTLGNGMRVNTKGFALSAAGGNSAPTRIDGGNSTLIVQHAPNDPNAFFTHQFHLTNGGTISLGSISPTLDGAEVEIGHPGSTVSSGSTLGGTGFVRFDNFGGNASTSVLRNNGTIRPGFGDLTLSTDGAFDLDGSSGNGVVDVDDGTFLSTSLKLHVNGSQTDAFDGLMQIGRGDWAVFSQPWQLGSDAAAGSGRLEMNGRDGIATLNGARVLVRGNQTEIDVVSGTARFFADLNIREATFNVADDTTVWFNREADFGSNSTFNPGSGYDLRVSDVTVFRQAVVDWDSFAPTNHVTRIDPGGILEFQTDRIDTADNKFDGHAIVQGGVLSLQTDNPWVHNGRIDLDHTNGSIGRVSGQDLFVGDGFDNGFDALIDVGGGGESRITSKVTFRSDAEVQIASNAQLRLTNNATIESGAEFTGGGSLINDSHLTTADGVSIAGTLVNLERLTVGGSGSIFGDLAVGAFEQTGQFTNLNMAIRSAEFGIYDQLNVAGTAELDGRLNVSLVGPPPQQGDQFPLITAGNLLGAFDAVVLPALLPGDVWNVLYSPSGLILEVAAPLAADFDGDGDVDGEDFLAWQANFGTSSGATPAMGDADGDGDVDGEDFLVWQTELGSSAAGNGASTAVPEPAAGLILLLAVAAGGGRRTRASGGAGNRVQGSPPARRIRDLEHSKYGMMPPVGLAVNDLFSGDGS